MSAETKLLKLQLAQAAQEAAKKKTKSKGTNKKTSKKKSSSVNDLIFLVLVALIVWILFLMVTVSAAEIESRYLTDAELLMLNEMDEEVDEIEKQYPLTEQITVCWNTEKQRLVPVYMGCK